MDNQDIRDYQVGFVNFLLESGALSFGEFVTKSGRATPYFINTGKFDTGSKISKLAGYYAQHFQANNLLNCDTIFGPAYKGIPLAVSISEAIFRNYQVELGFCFDRKEKKDHGDKGSMVGYPIKSGTKVVIVEDVITAGTTFREVVPLLREKYAANVTNAVIAVDRCERGSGQESARTELEKTLALEISPIVNIFQIMSLIDAGRIKVSGSDLLKSRIQEYMSKYVVRE